MSTLKNKNGFGILSVLISSVLMSITMLAFSHLLSNTRKYERSLTSNLDMTQLETGLHWILDRTSNCNQSGLVGLNVTNLLKPTPTPVPIPNLKYPNGAVFAQPTVTVFGTRKIDSLFLESPIQSAEGGGKYLTKVRVNTSVTGKAGFSRNTTRTMPLEITVDPTTKKISLCGNSDSESESEENVKSFGVPLMTLAQTIAAVPFATKCNDVLKDSKQVFYSMTACSRWCGQNGYKIGFVSECCDPSWLVNGVPACPVDTALCNCSK